MEMHNPENTPPQHVLEYGYTAADWHWHPNGGGWVHRTAFVADTAYVGPNAVVSGDAVVFGNARVLGYAMVLDRAVVFGNAEVYGHAVVSGSAWVGDNAEVSGTAKVCDNAWVFGDAEVGDNAEVSGSARIFGFAVVNGDAKVFGSAVVSGDAVVCGSARVYSGEWKVSPPYIQGTRHALTLSSFTEITIGCQTHPIPYWLECGEAIGRGHGYSDAEIAEYQLHIEHLARMAERLGADNLLLSRKEEQK